MRRFQFFTVSAIAWGLVGCLADSGESHEEADSADVASELSGGIAEIEIPAFVAEGADAEEDQPDLSRAVPYYENGGNGHDVHGGHQWVVLQALQILATDAGGDYSLPRAHRIVSMMQRPDCEAGWLAGIYEADEQKQYTGQFWEYHFYGVAEGGLSYTGSSTTAKTMAMQYLRSGMAKVRAGDYARGCFDLGLSLHFVTDIAQPMHVANFTAKDWPFGMHSRWEEYLEEIQERFGIAHWNGEHPSAWPIREEDADRVVEELAWSSYAHWEGALGVALLDYNAWKCNLWWSPWSACWRDMDAVHRESQLALERAQIQAANFMYTAFE